MVKKSLETCFRALARVAGGPFRAIAYGTTQDAGDAARVEVEYRLRLLLEAEHFTDGKSVVVVEQCDPFVAAIERQVFRNHVLALISSRFDDDRSPLVGRGTTERARSRLKDMSMQWAALKTGVDENLSGFEAKKPVADVANEEEQPVEASAETPAAPDASPRTWLLLVRNYEDLGAGGGAIADAIAAVVELGCHLVVAGDGLDTRKKEGRLIAEHLIRVGRIRADLARERARAEAGRRRKELRVYSHVPFGFRREGQRLVEIPEELAAVRRLQELAKQDLSQAEIALTLNAKKLFWKAGKPWTRLAVSRVLKNPIYQPHLEGSK